jgi:Family of unknown function (DUF5681)
MKKKSDNGYSIGFKKPPQHTQFKPGQSGNPYGRPKKVDTVADVLGRELNARIVVVKDGKRQKVSMLRAIIKQNLNMAVKGDSRAFANFLKALTAHRPDGGDNLGALVQEFRAIHEQHKEIDQERRKVSETRDLDSEAKEHTGVSPRKKRRAVCDAGL